MNFLIEQTSLNKKHLSAAYYYYYWVDLFKYTVGFIAPVLLQRDDTRSMFFIIKSSSLWCSITLLLRVIPCRQHLLILGAPAWVNWVFYSFGHDWESLCPTTMDLWCTAPSTVPCLDAMPPPPGLGDVICCRAWMCKAFPLLAHMLQTAGHPCDRDAQSLCLALWGKVGTSCSVLGWWGCRVGWTTCAAEGLPCLSDPMSSTGFGSLCCPQAWVMLAVLLLGCFYNLGGSNMSCLSSVEPGQERWTLMEMFLHVSGSAHYPTNINYQRSVLIVAVCGFWAHTGSFCVLIVVTWMFYLWDLLCYIW